MDLERLIAGLAPIEVDGRRSLDVSDLAYDARRVRPGALFFWYIGLYSVGRFVIEAVRVDSFWAGGYRVPQLASVAGFIVSVCGLVWVSRRRSSVAARGGVR